MKANLLGFLIGCAVTSIAGIGIVYQLPILLIPIFLLLAFSAVATS